MLFQTLHPNRFALYFFSAVIIVLLSAYFYGQWILIQIDNNLKEAEVTEQLGTPSTKSDSYEGWKTYRNDEFGFEFRYPNRLKIEEEENSKDSQYAIFLDEKKNDGFYVDALRNFTNAKDIVQHANESTWAFPDSWRNHFDVVNVNGQSILRNKTTASVVVLRGRDIFRVANGSVGWEDTSMIDLKEFDQIVSTFKFIEPAN